MLRMWKHIDGLNGFDFIMFCHELDVAALFHFSRPIQSRRGSYIMLQLNWQISRAMKLFTTFIQAQELLPVTWQNM